MVEHVQIVDLDIRPVFRTRLLDPRGRDTAPALPVITVSDPVAQHPEPAQPPVVAELLDPVGEVYDALVLATRDYAVKNGFTRSEEHTSELQSLMRISYAVFCLKKKTQNR